MKYFSKKKLIESINNKSLPDYVFIPPWKLITVSADICALANTKGGTLLYGIEENFTVVGAYNADFFIKTIKKRTSLINPKPNYTIYKYNIYNKDIIFVNVEELPLTEKLAYVNIYAYFMKNKQRVIATSLEKSYYSFLKCYSTELMQLYDYFYPDGKSTPYYFISKYIFPLINNGVLKLTDEKHKKSKNKR